MLLVRVKLADGVGCGGSRILLSLLLCQPEEVDMRDSKGKSLGLGCQRALLAAMSLFVLPTAGAFAEHFPVVHPLNYTPTSESVLFCSPCFAEFDNYDATPTSEQYLLDQLSRY